MRAVTFTLVPLILLASLTVFSCGGQQRAPWPSQQSSGASATDTNAVPVAPGVIGEWDDDRYAETLEQHRYRDLQASLLGRENGHVIFEPKTPQDHVSTRFVPVATGSSEVELVLQTQSSNDDGCIATLQDQDFKILATLPCGGTGEKKAAASVTGDVQRVRVYFKSEQLESQQLPQRIEIVSAARGE